MRFRSKIRIFLLGAFILGFQFLFFQQPIQALDQCSGGKMIIVQKEQNGKEITASIGDLIQIELSELGSAGYSWQIQDLDSKYLELISQETKRVSEEGKVGAPVLHLWRFKAKKVGQTRIKMDYYRKWEGVEKSAEHFLIKINIIEKGR